MTPNRQSPAYALFARHCYPAAQKFDIGVISTIRLMVLVALACGSKSEVNMSTAQGGGPQILSAFVKQRTYQPFAHWYFHPPQPFKTPTRGHGNLFIEGNLSDPGTLLGGPLARRNNQERINQTSFHGTSS
jgi:hypothetical protein